MSTKRRDLKEFVFENESPPTQSPQPVATLLLSAISLPGQQPRRYFEPVKMEQLIQSVKEHGILENLLVRPRQNHSEQYELVAGERRYRAAIAAGLITVPVTIRELTNDQALTIALVENLQREDLNPVEETEGILQLLGSRLQCAQSEVVSLLYRMQNDVSRLTDNVITQPEAELVKTLFTELGMMGWESFVSNRLPLLKLPKDILAALRQGQIEYTKAKAIARVKDEQQRLELLTSAITSALSLAQIKEQVRSLNATKSQDPDESNALKERTVSVFSRVQTHQLWSNSKKQKQLEKLLSQIENLLEAE